MITEETCLSCVDIKYSYELAKKMEREKTNPVLGYRTAGSKAEIATGDMLYEEMKAIGLSNVRKDAFCVDSWEFEKAVLKFRDENGKEQICQMGGYQTNFETEGFEAFELVDLGKGTDADYQGIDVSGKLVLVEMNQRDEWWISFPVYQAYLKGAKALIAVQTMGYGQADENSLNAQDIAGPDYAVAFSISQADAAKLRKAMKTGSNGKKEAKVWLDAISKVRKNQTSYNIVGEIPGEMTDQMILLTAHYDSYFNGFQDDNAAVAMILGMARALIRGGYRPAHKIVVCAMAAEEWGVIDSKYDWSTGAYRQVFQVQPQWQGKVIADFNFELPAHAHSTMDAVRCTYEYSDYLRGVISKIQVPLDIYPEGMTVLCPIETWSDDFSMAIAGIPSMVNDFSAGSFMENYYHSQYDNEDLYQEEVYDFHHRCYLRMIMEADRLVLPPLDFSRTFKAVRDSIDLGICRKTKAEGEELLKLLDEAVQKADAVYQRIKECNHLYQSLDEDNKRLYHKKYEKLSQELLKIFRKTQDYFVRLNWNDEVIFPQEAVQNNLRELKKAMDALEKREIEKALDALYGVDNNCYAFLFDEEVYYYFTEYILHQPQERLMWGAGRIMHHENLYGMVQRLRKKQKEEKPVLDEEIRRLGAAMRRQRAYYTDDIHYLILAVRKLLGMMEGLKL